MGYALGYGSCFSCRQPFSFNPVRVPSIRDHNNERQPVCKACVEAANTMRKIKGVALFAIPKDAYQACNEEEL